MKRISAAESASSCASDRPSGRYFLVTSKRRPLMTSLSISQRTALEASMVRAYLALSASETMAFMSLSPCGCVAGAGHPVPMGRMYAGRSRSAMIGTPHDMTETPGQAAVDGCVVGHSESCPSQRRRFLQCRVFGAVVHRGPDGARTLRALPRGHEPSHPLSL